MILVTVGEDHVLQAGHALILQILHDLVRIVLIPCVDQHRLAVRQQ